MEERKGRASQRFDIDVGRSAAVGGSTTSVPVAVCLRVEAVRSLSPTVVKYPGTLQQRA